jgi:hypothetical protein
MAFSPFRWVNAPARRNAAQFFDRIRFGHDAHGSVRCGKSRRVVSTGASGRTNHAPASGFTSIGQTTATGDNLMLLLLINILIIIVVGAILFWAIDKFVRDGRLANLLKILVVLICVAAILQRLWPILGFGF